MAKRGKRYLSALSNITIGCYSLVDAIEFLKSNSKCKFDESVEVHIALGLDPRNNEHNIRGMVSMPYGLGKIVRVAVFARDSAASIAKRAGADFVGAEDLLDMVVSSQIEFDVCVATPDMMSLVGKAGKVLGPRGLMPNPKLGTVTTNVEAAVTSAKSGQVEYRLDKNAVVHAGVGKISFPLNDIVGNVKAFVSAVLRAKPASVKGGYLKSVTVTSTMGVGLRLDTNEVYSF